MGLKIFFIGTVSLSQKALQKLLSLDAEIVGIATKSSSVFNSDHVDLSNLAEEHDIPWKYVKDINAPHIVEWIKSLQPDIIFCFGWSTLIKKELLELTELGVVGFHATALPENRGRHPLIWSLVLGLEQGASTFFFMKEGADDGDILSQKPYRINYEDDANSVYLKIESNALVQIAEFLPKLQKRFFKVVRQDHSCGNVWRKRGMKDGEIDFRMSSYAIYNLVRALTRPYVGAHLFYKNKEIKIWKVKEEKYDHQNIEPGKILESKSSEILVKTYDNAVRIIEHEFVELPKKGEYL
ncbi:formyltransferase family protein [Salinimicrobium sp. HB62]|uniref:formyltransferase family protein n=1 Tax=Salinimicrobium sp. HB62 TaxID=3077781 RepID=UPI002D775A61|nr:formyltransferase family protein [Salinimicrobium sp. HB62]